MASSNEEPLPRGVGRVPQWWMDITPHDTLDIEEDERRRQQEYEEAQMFAQLAAEADYRQQYGEGGMDYDPNRDGGDGSGEGGSGVGGASGWGGYQRGPDGKWMTPGGKEGRQFKAGQGPSGYVPGQHNGYYSPSRFMYGQGGLRHGGGPGGGGAYTGNPGDLNKTDYKYGRDANTQWQKPAWMQVKLRSTNAGSAIRKGKSYRADASNAPRPIGSGKTTAGQAPPESTPTPTPNPVSTEEESAQNTAPIPAPAPAPAPAPDPADGQPGGQPREGIGRLVKKIRRKKIKKRRPKAQRGDETDDEETAAAPAPVESAPAPAPIESEPAPAPVESAPVPAPMPASEPAFQADPFPEATEAAPEPAPAPKAKPAWAKARRAQVGGGDGAAPSAPAPSPIFPAQGQHEEEEYFEEVVEDSDGEYVEEIIIEDSDGEEVVAGGRGNMDVSSHDVTELQKALTRKANELKVLADMS